MHDFPIRLFRIEGSSMQPSLEHGSYVVVNKWYRRLKANYIILFLNEGKRPFVKRINAIAANGVISVVGDNRARSEDSRRFGPIKKQAVIGKVIAVI
jgi:signal peptidase I